MVLPLNPLSSDFCLHGHIGCTRGRERLAPNFNHQIYTWLPWENSPLLSNLPRRNCRERSHEVSKILPHKNIRGVLKRKLKSILELLPTLWIQKLFLLAFAVKPYSPDFAAQMAILYLLTIVWGQQFVLGSAGSAPLSFHGGQRGSKMDGWQIAVRIASPPTSYLPLCNVTLLLSHHMRECIPCLFEFEFNLGT